MSVANTLIADDSVFLVTDGGWTDLATGRLIDIKDKVFEITGAVTVLTAMGGAWVGPYVHMDAEQQHYGTYDEALVGIVQRLPTTIREVYEQVPGAPRHWGQFALVLAGWQDGPRANVVYVEDHGPTAPRITTLPAARYAAVTTAEKLDVADIEGSAVDLVEAQRLVVVPEGVLASGFVQLTAVGPDGVSRKVLHRWPDRIGERPEQSPARQ